MTRYKIGEEGTEMFPGEIIAKGAVKFPEDQDSVPVTIMFQGMPVGKATDLRSEDNGDLTVEIEFFKPEMEAEVKKIFSGSIQMNEVKYHSFRGHRFYDTGILREVSFTYDVPWAPGWGKFHLGFPDGELPEGLQG